MVLRHRTLVILLAIAVIIVSVVAAPAIAGQCSSVKKTCGSSNNVKYDYPDWCDIKPLQKLKETTNSVLSFDTPCKKLPTTLTTGFRAYGNLPWPVVKQADPNPCTSGQRVRFDIWVEYPQPGSTANIVDTFPAGFVPTGQYYLDGVPITPSRVTSTAVTFNNIPAPPAWTSGVRQITFYATAPRVTSRTTSDDVAQADFYVNGRFVGRYGWTLPVTVRP